MRTTNAQISLHIHAVWSAPLLFAAQVVDSVMYVVSVTKISSLMLASVAQQASLSLTWSETPEDMFSHVQLNKEYATYKFWSWIL